MWFLYAFGASVIWGVSYAASGRVIGRGVSALTFFTIYTAVGLLLGLGALAATAKLGSVPGELRGLGRDWGWLAVAVLSSAAAALLIYVAIGEKNATIASLIEISYPLFVALFAWAFFRETQFNAATILGAILILSGVGVVYLGNRH